jgi:hypothetical protein
MNTYYTCSISPMDGRDQRHKKTGCLPSLLGDGDIPRDKGIEIVYGEGKNILNWVDESSQGRAKMSCTSTTSPTNQPRKDPSLALLKSPFISVSTVSRGYPSLVSLVGPYRLQVYL